MADNTDRQSRRPDPIADRSLSGPLLIFAVLLLLSLFWALYDELIGQRPWKGYQQQFVRLYTAYLQRLGPDQAAAEKAVRESPEFRKIRSSLRQAEEAAAPRLAELDAELGLLRRQLEEIKEPFQDSRARIAALVYELDHTEDAGRKDAIRRDIENVRMQRIRVAWPVDGGAEPRWEELTVAEIEQRFNELKQQEARLNAERARITAPIRERQAELNRFLSERLVGLNQQQIDGLLRKIQGFEIGIKQIYVEEAGLVDRCESCHLGIREPLVLTAADLGGHQLFVSHPNKTLLEIHNPTVFGCSPCHNGNGIATSSVRKAHGRYKHWLWPLFPKENVEAGCLQCHLNDRVLEHAPVLTRGRDLYELKGCVGCHRYEGHDRETDALSDVRKQIQNLEARKREARLEAEREIQKGDAAETNQQAQAHYQRAENLRVTMSNIDAMIEALDHQAKSLMQDQKKVGPNLKDVRLKLRKQWIPVWLKDPQAFRPGTKMPAFRLADEEIRAVSAFIWQAGWPGPEPQSQPPGDAARGKELFETRGCLGCHSIGEGAGRMGGAFAANLSRLGEKANYEYIVRWIHNPRDRTRPYCLYEKRDLGPEDYRRRNLPFVFDLEHSTCPNDGHELQVQNMTVMPSLRLSWSEARDIATYLTSLKRDGASYPDDVAYMDDPRLAQRGRELVGRYGCAGCHEIQGLEDAPRIGTELTKEASKPMEQLDFGLLEREAKDEGWYSHKGFFEHKLENPAVYDEGREKAPEDRLRMPNIQLTQDDIRALTTFLLGSVDSPFRGQFRSIPAQFRYIPTDQQRDIQQGWWLIRKYNCEGCHVVRPGQESVLSTLPRYQDPDWKEHRPPSLIQEGARVNPDWLARFLANPALDSSNTQRNGVRTYLHARMPTFSFSPNEIRILVRFFEAMAGQPAPYIPTRVKPLEDRERQLARALFSSRGAPCLRCHLVGDPAHDRFATAPNFLIARERLKPGWTARWLLDPQAISPGTAMPSGLFRRQGDRWVFAGPTPAAFQDYPGDHVQLLVRYMFELSPAEQRRLIQQLPAAARLEPEPRQVARRTTAPP